MLRQKGHRRLFAGNPSPASRDVGPIQSATTEPEAMESGTFPATTADPSPSRQSDTSRPASAADPHSSAFSAAILLVQGVQQAEANIVRTRHALGKLIHELRYASSAGSPADHLSSLAKEINLKAATLRRFARVAETISAEELETYLALSGPNNFRLTWSHIEELTEERRKDVRRTHGETAATGCLSVAALRARIHAETVTRHSPGKGK